MELGCITLFIKGRQHKFNWDKKNRKTYYISSPTPKDPNFKYPPHLSITKGERCQT